MSFLDSVYAGGTEEKLAADPEVITASLESTPCFALS